MALLFHNTLTKNKQEFQPLHDGKVLMYNCGPTVYNYATIGNFRAFMLADLLRRYLEYRGFQVTQVMNLTDVGHMTTDADEGEDKMEKAAREMRKDPWQLAEFYAQAFFRDIDSLRIARAHVYPRATQHIPEMIALLHKLFDRGHAYIGGDGSVYYDLNTFPDYGRLSGNTLDKLQAGARIEVNPDKRNPFDFALWKTDPKHIMQWDSPWGRGFPGWHLECSAMSMKYLGNTIDIHTGGEDNIFPHHECEIAQSEGATGQTFVRYWLHTRFLLVEGRKMSKSLGNFYTLRDLQEKGYSGVAMRYLLLTNNYRQPLNFTFDAVEASNEAIKRIRDFLQRMREATGEGSNPIVSDLVSTTRAAFAEALDDDLNISKAMAAIFDFIRDVNKLDVSREDGQAAHAAIMDLNRVLDVIETEEETIEDEIERLIKERQEARLAKDFRRSDEIRNTLRDRGIILEDTPAGVRWKKAT
ncbi:MAG TPA: cysteine--tRNA ligase [Planctomycetota bacterium]|nr:cysteine--tRNA ligase [Planctomycetota bacterium]